MEEALEEGRSWKNAARSEGVSKKSRTYQPPPTRPSELRRLEAGLKRGVPKRFEKHEDKPKGGLHSQNCFYHGGRGRGSDSKKKDRGREKVVVTKVS